MAIVSITETFATKEGPQTEAGPKQTASRHWTAITDGATHTGLQIITAVGLFLGKAHPDIPGAVCENFWPRQDPEAEHVWRVEARYTTAPPSNLDDDPNPLNREAEISWDTVHVDIEAPEEDLDGEEFVDTAGTPLPAIVIPTSYLQLSVTKNQLQFDPVLVHSFIQATNKTTFHIGTLGGFPPYTALLDHAQATEHGTDLVYWRATYRFLFNKKLWHPLKVRSVGPRHLDWPNPIPIVARDGDGVSHNGLVKLDEDGVAVFGDEKAHVMEFRVHELMEFGNLGIFD